MYRMREAPADVEQGRRSPDTTVGAPASWRDYAALARPAHWIKHIFIVPGIVLAWRLHRGPARSHAPAILLGLASAALIASANYVLNEWLDAAFDAYHPIKSQRPAVTRRLSGAIVLAEYLGLVAAGLALATLVSPLFVLTAGLFLLAGLVYNVHPLRTKDRAHLDVISESLNNPLRLTLGWAMLDARTLPPGSLLAAYWMGGAFLMAVKRLAEYRAAVVEGGLEALHLYRRSFRAYNESSLLVASLVYAQLAGFFLAVFLLKYRIEYLLSLPFVAALFGVYLAVGLQEKSAAQAPEGLFRERALWLVMILLIVSLAVLTWTDIPLLDRLTSPHYIELPFWAR
jgi:4-hydroxybenzoate polyprenyltransferase